eukprot:TRINITY_DN21237_c0_g1_i4.p1 TRINITY_DN21237_c0_g1~~TRINITY_DN21237_c0_g1_i4.p1  ORF type:complete len:480 (+),score=77.82 TRINITY_DN21237_c0_g1_i4:153-1592(+)
MASEIEFYYWPVPCGWKIAIALEEMGLPYKVCPINILKGEQFDPEYLKKNPNNKIPTIVDPSGPDGEPFTVFESGAILLYLGEKIDKFLGGKPGSSGRHTVTQWLMFQMASIGPMFGQCGYFRKYARGTDEELRHGRERYFNEANRIYRVMEKRLSSVPYLAGEEYSVADMATYPWIQPDMHGIDLDLYPSVKRWYETIKVRPAVQRAYKLLASDCKIGDRSDETHKNLFDRQKQVGRASGEEPAAKRIKTNIQLWISPIKNHVHAVEAVISHCGLEDEVTMIATDPWKVEDGRPGFATLGACNPMMTVPALRTSDGRPMYGGIVIYEYLNSVRKAGKPSLFPESNQIELRRQLCTADGCFDNFVKLIIEGWEKEPRKAYAERTWQKVSGCLDVLNSDAERWTKEKVPINIAQIRCACLLDFLSNRMTSPATKVAGLAEDASWRTDRAQLATWFDGVKDIPCFTARLALKAQEDAMKRG